MGIVVHREIVLISGPDGEPVSEIFMAYGGPGGRPRQISKITREELVEINQERSSLRLRPYNGLRDHAEALALNIDPLAGRGAKRLIIG